MRDRRTLFGLTLLTTFLFETKSTLSCCHLPFFAYTSSNTVHLSFKTARVVQMQLFFLKLTFSLKPMNSYTIHNHHHQSECSKRYLFTQIKRNRNAHSSQIKNLSQKYCSPLHKFTDARKSLFPGTRFN
jgi:hypothetical protein